MSNALRAFTSTTKISHNFAIGLYNVAPFLNQNHCLLQKLNKVDTSKP